MQKSICFVALALMAFEPLVGQEGRGGRGVVLEESYLQESIDIMLIREQSRSESREAKESALAIIEAALARGTRSEEIQIALETMGLEGIVNRTMVNGAIVNSFPDIRRKTARCLGIMGGTEAYAILIRMLGAETQAFVLADVVNALMEVGLNQNNETVKLITQRVKHFDVTLPDDLLAFAALSAYERFASENGWRLDIDTEALLVSISNGRYHASARSYARDLLVKLRSYHG